MLKSLFVKRRYGNTDAGWNLADQVFYGLISLLGSLAVRYHQRAHDRYVHVCLTVNVVEPLREPQELIYLFQDAEGHRAYRLCEDLADVCFGK